MRGLVATHGSDCWWRLETAELLPPRLLLELAGEGGADAAADAAADERRTVQCPALFLLLNPVYPREAKQVYAKEDLRKTHEPPPLRRNQGRTHHQLTANT